jgi:plastocyanin
MKRLNAVRVAFSLGATFALVSLSQADPSNTHVNTAPQKQRATHVIRIVDQNGRPAMSGVPSGGGQIFDVAVGQGGFVFVPDTVNISVGDTVRWTWASNTHTVTSGDPCTANGLFCSPDDMNCDQPVFSNTGFVYEHTFPQAGTFSYFCAAHCGLGMTGVVNVASAPTPTPTPTATPSATPSVTPPPPTPTPSPTPGMVTPTPTPTPPISPTPGRPRPSPRPRPTPHPRP